MPMIFIVASDGSLSGNSARNNCSFHPVLHLKFTIKITGETGSSTNSFILSV